MCDSWKCQRSHINPNAMKYLIHKWFTSIRTNIYRYGINNDYWKEKKKVMNYITRIRHIMHMFGIIIFRFLTIINESLDITHVDVFFSF